MTKYANIGLLFNKHYFREIRYTDPNNENFDYKKDAHNRAVVSGNNKMLFNSSLNNSPLNLGNCHFELKTIYPGLFLGSGYPHEAGIEGELKLGFFFDYSTGIPILPGSSVKGVLRNAFEVANGGYLKELLENKLKLETWKVENLLDRKIKVEGIKEKIPYIVASIFHGYYPVAEADKIIYKQAGVYQRDIFFDAIPVGKVAEGKFLANDFITPHKDNEGNFNPLKDPVPLQFLKILPGITFHFDFKLHNTLDENGKDLLTASQKKDLFRFILEDLGIGAKTNVGYGQFINPENIFEQKIHYRVIENTQYTGKVIKKSDTQYLIEMEAEDGMNLYVRDIDKLKERFYKEAKRKKDKKKLSSLPRYKEILDVGDELIIIGRNNNGISIKPIWLENL